MFPDLYLVVGDLTFVFLVLLLLDVFVPSLLITHRPTPSTLLQPTCRARSTTCRAFSLPPAFSLHSPTAFPRSPPGGSIYCLTRSTAVPGLIVCHHHYTLRISAAHTAPGHAFDMDTPGRGLLVL